MLTSPNPIRDILGPLSPPPAISTAQYETEFNRFIGDASQLSALEIFILSDIFYQYKNIDYLQAKRRRLFSHLLCEQIEDHYMSFERPKTWPGAVKAIKAGLSPEESAVLAQFLDEAELNWHALQDAVYSSRDYKASKQDQDIDGRYACIEKLQKMLGAASLTPAMKRRLEAQTRLVEQELKQAERTIEHSPA